MLFEKLGIGNAGVDLLGQGFECTSSQFIPAMALVLVELLAVDDAK